MPISPHIDRRTVSMAASRVEHWEAELARLRAENDRLRGNEAAFNAIAGAVPEILAEVGANPRAAPDDAAAWARDEITRLRAALTEIATGGDSAGLKVDFPRDIAAAALAQAS